MNTFLDCREIPIIWKCFSFANAVVTVKGISSWISAVSQQPFSGKRLKIEDKRSTAGKKYALQCRNFIDGVL